LSFSFVLPDSVLVPVAGRSLLNAQASSFFAWVQNQLRSPLVFLKTAPPASISASSSILGFVKLALTRVLDFAACSFHLCACEFFVSILEPGFACLSLVAV
jgi:hypothetical protein